MRQALQLAITAAIGAALLLAQATRTAEVELKAVQHQAEVEGDLKGAIGGYSAIVAKYKSDRGIVAMALVRMADCYQKMGDAEARKLYLQVVKEYADQKEAVALARAKIGNATPRAGAMGDRVVWTGPEVDLFGMVSPNGRFVTYVDWARTGNLMLRDLPAGTARPLTPNVKSYGEFGEAGFSAISKDGKRVAYHWAGRDGRPELRVASIEGSGIPESRAIFQYADARDIEPFDWSPDGNWLAVFLARQDATGQIGLIGIHDGAWRPLRSTDWRGPNRIFFSPDGRHIAYDLPRDIAGEERDVFVMATDASRETAAVEHRSRNYVMGWSPDGKHLLFASDRSGATDLWALPVTDGRVTGPARQVEAGIGSSWSLGLTGSGALYVFKNPRASSVQVSAIDLPAGKLVPSRAGGFQHFISSKGTPYWSPDGKRLAFRFCSVTGGGPCGLAIASFETGKVREVWPKLAYMADFNGGWSTDSEAFLTIGTDLKGRRGTYRIDIRSGEAAPVEGVLPGDILSPDERKVYRRTVDAIVERDLSSGQQRQIYRRPAHTNVPGMTVSPDGRYIAFHELSENRSAIYVVAEGGSARELIAVNRPEQFTGRIAWTPDNRALIVPRKPATDAKLNQLWLVPVDGGTPRKLDIDVGNWDSDAGFAISPDGHQVAYVASAGKPGYEVWALENYLPALAGEQEHASPGSTNHK